MQDYCEKQEKTGKAKAALASYEKVLKNPSRYGLNGIEKFALEDINRDGVKEAIFKETLNIAIPVYRVYSYFDGKLKLIMEGMSGRIYYYPKAKVLKRESKYDIEVYYKISGRALKEVVFSGHNFSDVKTMYYINGKKTTKAAHKSYLKKLIGSEKAKEFRFITNTAGNRKKYL